MAEVVSEVKNSRYFTTSAGIEYEIGKVYKVFSSENSKAFAYAELRKCNDKVCLFFVKKIKKNTEIKTGDLIEKYEVPEEETKIARGKRWASLGWGAPLPMVIRIEFGFQNIAGSDLDLGINLGQLPGSLNHIDLKGQTIGLTAQYRVPQYNIFWDVFPKFIAEVGMIKGEIDISPISKVSEDKNDISEPYALVGFMLSKQFKFSFIDLGVGYSYNTLKSPQQGPSGARVSTSFAGTVPLFMLSGGFIF